MLNTMVLDLLVHFQILEIHIHSVPAILQLQSHICIVLAILQILLLSELFRLHLLPAELFRLIRLSLELARFQIILRSDLFGLQILLQIRLQSDILQDFLPLLLLHQLPLELFGLVSLRL